MGIKFLVNAARVCVILSTLASLVSLGGGGLVLPPFKSTSWLVTSSSHVGLYGGCLSQNLDSRFFSINSDWKELQVSDCANTFIQSAGPASIVGRLIPRDEIMLFSVQALAFVLGLTTLFISRVEQPQTLAIFSFAAFVFQGLSFGWATYQFKLIWSSLSSVDADVSFGIGMYLSGAAAVSFLLASLFGWSAIRSSSHSKSFGYSSFRDSRRDSRDTYF